MNCLSVHISLHKEPWQGNVSVRGQGSKAPLQPVPGWPGPALASWMDLTLRVSTGANPPLLTLFFETCSSTHQLSLNPMAPGGRLCLRVCQSLLRLLALNS